MNTFEQEFNRSPTEQDFKIQRHTLEVLYHVLTSDNNVNMKDVFDVLQLSISELKKK